MFVSEFPLGFWNLWGRGRGVKVKGGASRFAVGSLLTEFFVLIVSIDAVGVFRFESSARGKKAFFLFLWWLGWSGRVGHLFVVVGGVWHVEGPFCICFCHL